VVLVGCVAGFVVGGLLATALLAWGAHLSGYPGGLGALTRSSRPPWWSNALSLAGLWAGFGIGIYVAATAGRLRPLVRQWRLVPSDALYVLVGIACQGLVDAAYYPFHIKSLNQPVTHLFGGARGVTFALMAVLTTLCAPFVEEWFFRGVLYRALLAGFSEVAPRVALAGAVVVSAGLFALAHGEPVQFAGLAFLGVVLALLVYRTQRLMPSVITHLSFNAVAMIALIVQRSGH
jgi:membrane protease YdiL (CAAX protease family)